MVSVLALGDTMVFAGMVDKAGGLYMLLVQLFQHWCSLLLAVTVSGILEAYTAQLDNAFIPLIFYSLLCL
ncbi:hypothetical protein C1H46_040292 [Malus baccata]|uniref:dolichol kinase n=1 Tax=Malus baccata TaxID=106549 RepID=A0A540KJ39_MALBA|nr:hypothetical protein C1H46_040292 [Malus baccata]